MTLERTTYKLTVLVIGWIACLQPAFASDETLARAKDLYASAAYDEALAVLDHLEVTPASGETRSIAEYRVFCLLALDRRDEARKNIEAMLRDNPHYLPSPDQASPRIQSVFHDVRRQSLPKIVMERYAAAKAAFERKDPQAAEQFEGVLTLLEDPDVQGAPALADLRTVVTAFRDLTQAMTSAPLPVSSIQPVSSAAPQLSRPVAPHRPSGRSEPSASPAAENNAIIYTSADTDVAPPVPQSQPLPRWTPVGPEAMQDFKGTLELLIDERGAVTSVTMRAALHPAYNALLLRAVREWKFLPARRQGTPVRYLKVIDIYLKPGKS